MMFHYDRGLKLTGIDLAIDVRRRQPRGFISHAHADHMAPHELAFCTPATGKLYQHRLGKHRALREMPFGKPLAWQDWQLTTVPAGHVFGSAMLLAEFQGQRLLYSGDFKLEPSLTAEPCTPPAADILIMESTWGSPQFKMPPRKSVEQELIDRVTDCFTRHRTPVIHAYVLGKAQEVTKILTNAGIPVLQHPLIYEVSQVYEACGCELGNYQRYPGAPLPHHAVIAPPRSQKGYHLANLARPTSIAVTGWALQPEAHRRWQCDYLLPLSDHADFQELLEFVDRVNPQQTLCTHGPPKFVEHLRARGRRAQVLGQPEERFLAFMQLPE